jgi:hypothetical protein
MEAIAVNVTGPEVKQSKRVKIGTVNEQTVYVCLSGVNGNCFACQKSTKHAGRNIQLGIDEDLCQFDETCHRALIRHFRVKSATSAEGAHA